MNTETASTRIASIDMLRGLVMVLMALDHTRDFFSNAHFSPTDLNKTTLALFFTRWITHFCAPVFVFFAGSSAYFWKASRGKDAAVSRYLVKRGLLLIFLVFTVEAWAWDFRYDFQHIYVGVLWAIGWSMIVLAGLVRLPLGWIVTFGSVLIVSHNALDWLKPAMLGGFGPFWAVLHSGDKIKLAEGWELSPSYPLIPWIGVMAVGYGFGKWMSSNSWRTPRNLKILGWCLISEFILLRFSNLYGDPNPWQLFPQPTVTLLSFLNCHKYPPSLLYLLMTLGPALLLLAWFEKQPKKRWEFLQVFGRTPLFYYLLHLYLIHIVAVLIAAITAGPVSALLGGGIWVTDLPADYGYALPGVYAIWLVIVLMLYPLCRGLESLKAKRPNWYLLKYL